MTQRTKKYLWAAIILTTLSILLSVGPALIFTVQGFMYSNLVVEKVALTGALTVAIIGSMMSLLSRVFQFRSRIWLILLALFFILDHFTVIILTLAITQILDELIFAPIAKHCRSKYSINREIDKRG